MNKDCIPIIRKDRVTFFKKIGTKTLIRTIYRNNREGFYLNKFGVEVYERCNGLMSCETILEQLKTIYVNATEEQLVEGLKTTFSFFEKEGIIDWTNGKCSFDSEKYYKYENLYVFRNLQYYEIESIEMFLKDNEQVYVSPYQEEEIIKKQYFMETLLIRSRNYVFCIEENLEVKGFALCQYNQYTQTITIISQKFEDVIDSKVIESFYKWIANLLNAENKVSYIFLFVEDGENIDIPIFFSYKGRLKKELKKKNDILLSRIKL
ncbi:MAG: hypothetical protein SOY47_15120 [Lachnospiraceae bacterium]|nr:hypothetical protein [Lachnospiraceae bacterium]